MLITSLGFFIFFFGHAAFLGVLATLGTSPLVLVVFFGAAQNTLCRSAKFTLFDSTKEMAFIPLDLESKIKGKAVIDGVGSRIGKSAGSLIHQGLLLAFSSIAASAHIVAGVLFGVIGVWLVAVCSLGRKFNALTSTPASADESLLPAATEQEPVKQEAQPVS